MSCLHLKRSIFGKGSGISNFRTVNTSTNTSKLCRRITAIYHSCHVDRASLQSSVGSFPAQIAALKTIYGDPLLKYIYLKRLILLTDSFQIMPQQRQIPDRSHDCPPVPEQPHIRIFTPHDSLPHTCSTTILHSPLRHPRHSILRRVVTRR